MPKKSLSKKVTPEKKAEPKKTGRKSIFTDELGSRICKRLTEGESLISICRDKDMPHRTTINDWLFDDKHKAFAIKYMRARDEAAERMFEELLDIADDGTNDYVEKVTESGHIKIVADNEHINRSRLRVDTRKWYLSKVLPKKYGDKLDVEHSGGLKVNYGHRTKRD